MDQEYRISPSFQPWGPFIGHEFEIEPITRGDIVIASVVWALTLSNVFLAIYLGYGQTKSSRSPLRSIYVWLIWLELLVSFLMGIECYLHLFKIISPSFAFYFTILFWWCIQVQLLLQIIINRIRIIVPNRKRSRSIMIVTATVVTLINISVFNIWIPARLQTSHRYILINEIWDRIEKVLYLLIDAALNWYFLKVVKANLINNGLQKYYKLLRFNQRIIVLSLFMDVMIIAAMSIPNSFVYIQFHPLAYLVKLNIEMTMANLIKRIAISKSKRTGNASLVREFASTDQSTNSAHTSNLSSNARRNSIIELKSNIFRKVDVKHDHGRPASIGLRPTGKQIKKTEEICVRSDPVDHFDTDDDNARWEAVKGGRQVEDEEWAIGRARELVSNHNSGDGRSLDGDTEGESVNSVERQRKDDSDDEVTLVTQRQQWPQGLGAGWRRFD